MRKIILFLIIGFLILSSFGVDAVSYEKESLNREETWQLLIDIKGGLFGYDVIVTNVGEESVTGDLTIDITTDAGIMLLGRNLELIVEELTLNSGDSESFDLTPVLGFGFADITITGEFLPFLEEPYTFDMEATNGFVLLLFVRVGVTPITIPPR